MESNFGPGAISNLPAKGRLGVGADADLAVLDRDDRIHDVMARGQFLVRDGAPVARGPFE